MGAVLHAERSDSRAERTRRLPGERLPDGTMVAMPGDAYALREGRRLRRTAAGCDTARPRPPSGEREILTPPAILAVLAAGYAPAWHPSAAPAGVAAS